MLRDLGFHSSPAHGRLPSGHKCTSGVTSTVQVREYGPVPSLQGLRAHNQDSGQERHFRLWLWKLQVSAKLTHTPHSSYVDGMLHPQNIWRVCDRHEEDGGLCPPAFVLGSVHQLPWVRQP